MTLCDTIDTIVIFAPLARIGGYSLDAEQQYQAALALVNSQMTYEDWVAAMHANGLHNVAPVLAQLRQRGDVQFQLEVNPDTGARYHTVRPANTDYVPTTWGA
jgi:hypothetical protein